MTEDNTQNNGEVTYSNFVKEDGSFAENWLNLAPEEYRNENSLKAIPDFPTMVKSYVNAQKMVGANKVALPGKNATPEEWNAFYAATGRPEKPEHYNLEVPKDLPKDFPIDPNRITTYAKKAHELGLNPNQVKGLYDWFMREEKTNWATYGQMLETEQGELANSISVNPYERDKLKKTASDVMRVFANEGVLKLAEKTGLKDDPAFVLIMNEVASKLSEETMKGLKPKGADETSRTAIQEKINAIMDDKNSPYWNKKDPKHRETVAMVERLYQQLSPE